MFKLILLLILFLLFVTNYFFSYFKTIPRFEFISHLNFYTYVDDKFENRKGSFTGIDMKIASNSGTYILDYTWWVLQTDLKYLWPTSDKLDVYIPILILHTWNNILYSWDNIFTWWKFKKNFMAYNQYITWWNDYIDIWSKIENWKEIKQTLYLWYFYTYCSMSDTWWIDAYYFDRYKKWNKIWTGDNQQKINNAYVCKSWVKLWLYTKQECIWWTVFWSCNKTQDKNYYACNCNNKWEYEICKQNNDINTNPDLKTCDNNGDCIDYYTWTINLNNTNCSLSWVLWIDSIKLKKFLIR
jgi:hypothetical protein